jgi:hypothetical protein
LGKRSRHARGKRPLVGGTTGMFHHAPGGARGADSPAFAGEGYKVVVPTVAAASAGKAMGKDAALKILGKRFAHEGLGGVVVALAVELTRAGQL